MFKTLQQFLLYSNNLKNNFIFLAIGLTVESKVMSLLHSTLLGY